MIYRISIILFFICNGGFLYSQCSEALWLEGSGKVTGELISFHRDSIIQWRYCQGDTVIIPVEQIRRLKLFAFERPVMASDWKIDGQVSMLIGSNNFDEIVTGPRIALSLIYMFSDRIGAGAGYGFSSASIVSDNLFADVRYFLSPGVANSIYFRIQGGKSWGKFINSEDLGGGWFIMPSIHWRIAVKKNNFHVGTGIFHQELHLDREWEKRHYKINRYLLEFGYTLLF